MSGSERHVGAPACALGFEQDPLREGRTVLEGPGCLHVNTTGHPAVRGARPARPSAQRGPQLVGLDCPPPQAGRPPVEGPGQQQPAGPQGRHPALREAEAAAAQGARQALRVHAAHVPAGEQRAPAHSPPCPSGRQGGLAEGLAVSSHGLMILSPTVGPEPLGFSRPSRVAW